MGFKQALAATTLLLMNTTAIAVPVSLGETNADLIAEEVTHPDELKANSSSFEVTRVPEPSTLILLGLGIAGLSLARKRAATK